MSSTHLSRAKVFPFLVDSHAHLDFNDFDGDREKVLERAESRGLKLIINIGCDLQSSQKSIRLAEKYPIIYTAVGIHPHEAAKVPPDYLKLLREMSVHPKVVAIGEIGLDFFRNRSPRDRQIEVFRRQLQLAREVNLPVVLHDREAHEEMVSILEADGLPPAGGVMHCFSGDLSLAKKSMEMGLYISIAGPVTYPKNKVLGQVAATVPADRLIIETDAPFLPPASMRGKRNEPGNVVFTAEKVAALRGTTGEKIGRICLENTKRLFSIE